MQRSPTFAPRARSSPDTQQSPTDRYRALHRARAIPPAVWSAVPCDSFQPAIAHQQLAAASNPPTPVTCAGSLRLSVQSVPETSPYPAMAWDRGAPRDCGARCDDASKLLQSLADTLRAVQT